VYAAQRCVSVSPPNQARKVEDPGQLDAELFAGPLTGVAQATEIRVRSPRRSPLIARWATWGRWRT
jgi:hypothetical protein